MNEYKPLKIKQLKTYSIHDRESKVKTDDFAKKWQPGKKFSNFLKSLPNILAAQDLKYVINSMYEAYKNDKPIVIAMGAHVIKVGLNPVLIDLMERGVITAIAMNGAGIIHDSELAIAGKTSEDVESALGDGAFGMAKETSDFLSHAIKQSQKKNTGLGEAVGNSLLAENFPFIQSSLLATGARLGIPITVHVAIGTDIIHMHPDFDPAIAGLASHLDFRKFASVIAKLEKGVYINIGSAVVLPEVFLKAISLVRNMGYDLTDFTAVNMDFIKHYRPTTNVVNRPTSKGGRGINLIGHHEIMFPLIAAGLIEKISN